MSNDFRGARVVGLINVVAVYWALLEPGLVTVFAVVISCGI